MTFEIGDDVGVQEDFDKYYAFVHTLLDQFYNEQEITVTSADPHFITPTIKSKLRRRNRLMRAGRTEEACAMCTDQACLGGDYSAKFFVVAQL